MAAELVFELENRMEKTKRSSGDMDLWCEIRGGACARDIFSPEAMITDENLEQFFYSEIGACVYSQIFLKRDI